METVQMNVKGMTCQHCVKTVKGALEPIPGVESVEISLDQGEIKIVYDSSKVQVPQFKTAIEESGYEVHQ